MQAQTPEKVSSSYPVSPSPSFQERVVPPGLEDLSEEERQKILAVMASAELDSTAALNKPVSSVSSKIPISHTSDSFFRNEGERSVKVFTMNYFYFRCCVVATAAA